MKSQLATLQRQSANVAGPIVKSRLGDLLKASKEQPLNRNHVNALLRQNLSRIELEFESRSLLIEWKQGGTARVIFGFPK